MDIWVAVVSGLLGTSGGLIAALVTQRFERQKLESELKFQEQKLQRELQAEREALRTEYGLEQSVEAALRHYLQIAELPYRTFSMIRHHIGGFESNELRKHLVRSGAVRFMAADGSELWALRDRVSDNYKHSRWKHSEKPKNKTPEKELFPGAFGNSKEF